MKVLDASYLVDYEHGVEAAKEYLLSNRDDEFVIPAPVHVEYLLGDVHSARETDLAETGHELSWATVHSVGQRTSRLAAEVADEVGPQGPQLTGIDALVAGTARELGASVVASDGDLTHPEVKSVVPVDEYR